MPAQGCGALLRALAAAALLAAIAAAAPAALASLDGRALAADDECGAAGAGACALEALQLRREVTAAARGDSGSGGLATAEPEAPQRAAKAEGGAELEATHEALLEAMARGGVRAEHVAEARAQLAAGAGAKAAANASSGCSTWTGGTCFTSGCSASRGSVHCVHFHCDCMPGFCSSGGTCAFDYQSAMSAWGGNLGAVSGGSGGSSGGSSWTGGTCMTSDCDVSRGPTDCGLHTGFRCMCKAGLKETNGACVAQPTMGWGMWR